MDRYKVALHDICQIVRDFIHTPNFKRALICGVALYSIALFALLRGDIYYMDDFQHSISDSSNANVFSRYLIPLILGGALTLGKGTLDISPLPQILGVIFVVLSAMILLYLIRKKFDFIGILASLPLGLSPHFLQNLSYKFDALTMSLALFFAVLPFLFQKQVRVFCVISVVCLLLMFMIYQAANAAYIILSLYFALFTTSQNLKSRLKFLGLCALNLIIASALYKLTIAQPVSEYIVAYTSDKMLPLNADFFTGLAQNLTTYFATIFSDLKQTPYIWLIALNCALFMLNYKNRRIYAILFLALGFCASFGLFLVLEKPVFEPRVFYGFSALIATICIANIAESNKILRLLSRAIAIITAYFLISFANIYGNALTKQDKYLDFRAKLLLQDLGEKIPQGAMIDLYIYIDKHAVARRFSEKYGEISRLIPQVADNDWFFHWRLSHLNARYNFHNREMCSFLKENFGSEVVFKNAYHTIERAKSCYVVTLK